MGFLKRAFCAVSLCLAVGVCLIGAASCKDGEKESTEHVHTFISEVETVAPSCETAGEIVRFCACGFTSTSILPARGHTLTNVSAQEATCEEIGWKAYVTCSRCAYTTYDEIAALGHGLTNVAAREATCTEVGWDAYDECARCGYTTYQEIPAFGHTVIPFAAKAPTCLDVGWEAYEVCEKCTYTTYRELPALGHALSQREGKEATCLATGWEAYESCARCAYTTYTELPALGHDRIAYGAQEPTCENIGWKAYEACSRCEYTTYQELSALGHNKEYCEVKVPVSCEKNGLVLYVCMRCGYDHGYEVIRALGHILEEYQAKEADCETSGWAAYTACGREGCGYTTQVIVPPTGHDWKKMLEEDGYAKFSCLNCGGYYVEKIEAHTHVFGEFEISWQPTCEKAGAQERMCACGTIDTEEVPALGHSLKTHDGKAPTCENIGWERYETCERENCAYSTYREIPALGHDLIQYEGCEATCLQQGWMAYEECERCAYTTYQQIPTLPHEEIVDNAVSATCETNGLTEGSHCKNCGKVLNKQTETPATGHAWDGGVPGENAVIYICVSCGAKREEKTEEHTHVFDETEITHASTCEGEGIKTLKCACGEEKTETIPALGHDLRQYQGQAATCEEDGWTAYEACERCAYTTRQILVATGHDYQSGVCKNCGKLSNDGTRYELSADGAYYICVGRRTENDRFVVIADEWKGLPVEEIAENAFSGCETLVRVTIGKNVKRIGKNAFNTCYNLVEVYNRSALTIVAGGYHESMIGNYAQAVYTTEEYKSGIKEDENGFITYTAGWEVRLIGYTGEKTELTLPLGITRISQGVCSHCAGLKQLTLSETVQTIGSYTFKDCASLTEVTVGTGVTKIEAYAFSGAVVLSKVYFEQPSGWYTTKTESEKDLSVSKDKLADATAAAKLLTEEYCLVYWVRD